VLTEQLAQLAIEQGRAQRAAQSAASGPVDIGAKKNSRPSASRKDTAKQKPSSRRSVKRSPRKG
jgi:hypothetical protein